MSIHETITRPLTILHLEKPSFGFEQVILSVRAVVEAEPIRKRMKAMVVQMKCERIPKRTWAAARRNPMTRYTVEMNYAKVYEEK